MAILVLAVLGYLQPFHSIPWMSAVNSGIFLVLGLVLAAGCIVANRHTTVGYGWGEVCALSLIVLHGVSTYNQATQKSVLPTVLVLGITYLCVKLPLRQMQIGGALMLGVFVAGLVSALFGIGLWLGAAQQYEAYQVWMAHSAPGSPLISNLGQPNHAGTLFVWALAVAAFYAHQLENSLKPPLLLQAGQGVLLACALIIICAAVLTQSRTAMLNLALMLLVSLAFRKYFGVKAVRLVVVSAVMAVIMTMLLSDIKQLLFDAVPSAMFGGKLFGDNARSIAYTTFALALQAHWVTGYGIGGVTTAYLENLSAQSPLNSYFGAVHNLPLEILVCLGLPLGGGVLVLLSHLLTRAGKNVQSVKDGVLFFMVIAALVHAMLEYPLHYAYFLLPAAIFIKLLQPDYDGRTVRIAWYLLAMIWLALAALFYVVAESYFEVEYDLRQAKVQAALFGKPRPAANNYSNLIRELGALNIALRTDVTSDVSSAEMQAYDLVSHVYPTRQLIQNYTKILMAKGRECEAAIWRKRSSLLYGDD